MFARVVTAATCLALLVGVMNIRAAMGGSSRPARPVINEPAAAGQIVHPGDVHMESLPYMDPDGDSHLCTTWLIVVQSNRRVAWRDPCDGVNKTHAHLGDGTFVNNHAGRTELKPNKRYVLRVRHIHDSPYGRVRSRWAERPFVTAPSPPPGSTIAWTTRQAGFVIEPFAGGLQLPVNIAFLHEPGPEPSDPLMYVTELHGSIKVIARDGTVSDYYNGALNYTPPLSFPGAGEQGLTGIVVEPQTGDVFASLMYAGADGLHYPKIVRFKSAHGGAVAESSSLVIEFPSDPMGASHQISNLSIGPDGMLYSHLGDGYDIPAAQNPDLARGKILRLATDGTAPPDNPFYDPDDGITIRDYVFALGFRNPFGGAWRAQDGAHYTVENGPLVDRFARIVAGRNYLWDGSDASMTNYALYNWTQSTAPVNLAFMEADIFDGGDFPDSMLGHAFVTESGPTYAAGDTERGKVITEFSLDPSGNLVSGPTPLVEYTGTGRATVSGLAFGPGGLYFTDLYKDMDTTGPTDRGARVLVVKWVGQ